MKENVKYESEVLDDLDNGIEEMFEEKNKEAVKVVKKDFAYTDRNVVIQVYSLARTVASIFRENNLTFWTSGGTTLGLVRHQGLIPWDDDVDICIKEEDLEKFIKLTPKFEAAGCSIVQSNSYVWKVFHKKNSSEITGKCVDYRYPFCDVFIMTKKKSKYVICDKSGECVWPEEWYTEQQIENISWRQFADFQLPCPDQPEQYLSRTYGEDWDIIGSTHNVSHNSRDILISTKFNLEEGHFDPATPFH